jgi:hypothetical protein
VNQPVSAATLPYVPPGHPVRRFVVAIVVLAALLGIVWWSGVGRPRLSVEVREVGPGGATIILTNDARTRIDLRAASFEDPRLDGETIDLPSRSLSGGQLVEVTVSFTPLCTPTPPGGYYLPLRVTVHTALGLDRTVDAGNLATIGDLACDAGADVPDEDG